MATSIYGALFLLAIKIEKVTFFEFVLYNFIYWKIKFLNKINLKINLWHHSKKF